MIGFIQKIVLAIVTLGSAVFWAFLLYSVFYQPNYNKNLWLLVPLALSALSLSSFVFHVKTLQFYRNSSAIVKSFTNNRVIWYLDLAFGVSIILLAFFFAYEFSKLYDSNIETEFLLLSIVVLCVLLFGAWLCLDYYHLFKKLNIEKLKGYTNQIDEISGNTQN